VKKIAVLLVFVFSLFVFAHPAKAANPLTCEVTITKPDNSTFTTDRFSGKDNGVSDYKIPFDVPLKISLTFFDDPDFDSDDCHNNDEGAYVELKSARFGVAVDYQIEKLHFDEENGSCDSHTITFNRTFKAEDFNDDWNLSLSDFYKAIDSFGLLIKYADGKDFGKNGSDGGDEIKCEVIFKVEKGDNFYEDHRYEGQCDYPTTCTLDGKSGRRLCAGQAIYDANGTFARCDGDDAYNDDDERCTQCFICDDVCYPGCQGEDPSNTDTYATQCADPNFKAQCGNGVCEAGEGFRPIGNDGSATNYCPNDCQNRYSAFSLCGQIAESSPLRQQCESCSLDRNGVWTAVGCISTKPESMVKAFLQIGLSASGGIAILMMLSAGFILSISQGEPKRTTQAKEMFTSAIVGLLFVIFSITLLQFIGVSLIQIPGFGG
jgi:hypothetical protein